MQRLNRTLLLLTKIEKQSVSGYREIKNQYQYSKTSESI